MKVPGDNVVQMPQTQQIDPKYLLMAAAQMHSEGRLVESGSSPESGLMQVAAKGPQGDVRPIPIRSKASLNRALDEAEGDDELRAIRDRLRKRGISTDHIRDFEGLD